MLVKIRNSLNSDECMIEISKKATVGTLKKEIEEKFKVKSELQRLYYRGKHLEKENTLYDYKIDHNDVIQLMIKSNVENEDKVKNEKNDVKNQEKDDLVDATSNYYKVGDLVDCVDEKYGAWFEASIVRICRKEKKLIYVLQWDFIQHSQPFHAEEQLIRPRAWKIIPENELKKGQKVMINHNLSEPSEIGHWYDFKVNQINKKRNKTVLVGTLFNRNNEETLTNYSITLSDKIFEIEQPKLLKDRTEINVQDIKRQKRNVAPECFGCNDKPNVKCSECGCKICGGKDDPHRIILCDECEDEYHIGCLKPPLSKVPEDDWYCPTCKNDENEIVKMGQKVTNRISKNKVVGNKTRDWGRGMACIGRTTECTIVKKNHRGPIPGVEVGSSWWSRMQVSESGVHRPPVAGIHGIESDCAYSIVLSTGYGDVDRGLEFIYTGSGGRDLSGNKRTAKQSSDQVLTRANKALAINCNATFNDVEGAEAEDWKAGIPVRVVRNYKLAKHSEYAPKEGNRYDGLYKVVKYYPEKNEDGLVLWRYLLRRDDPAPPPWTPEGKKRSEKLGLQMQYPEGFDPSKLSEKSNNKRDSLKNNDNNQGKPPLKKMKVEAYNLDDDVSSLIEKDTANFKLWKECKSYLSNGKISFLNQVSKSLECVCCQDLVFNPVTTPCAHNICQSCLKRSFTAGVNSCPTCRFDLKKDFELTVNEKLANVLVLLFPGYQGGRK